MTDNCHRRALAQEMARQLLRPGILDLPARSGLFLFGLHRAERTIFLCQYLLPALESGHLDPEQAGRRAIVIYVDLRPDGNVSPAELISHAVRAKLLELITRGFQVKFDLCKLGERSGATLAEAFSQVVDEERTDLVLVVNEVQECVQQGDGLMKALKAARDAINLRPSTPGHFLLVCAGGDRTLVQNMVVGTEAPFSGAAFRDLSAPF